MDKFGVRSIFQHLTSKERKYYLSLSSIQCLSGVFDLIGILLFGVSGILISEQYENTSLTNKSDFLQRIPAFLTGISISQLMLLAAMFMIFKSLFSIVSIRSMLLFLPQVSERIALNIYSNLISTNSVITRKLSPQEISYATNLSTNYLFIDSLAALAILVSEIALIVIFMTVLSFLDPTLTLLLITFVIGGTAILQSRISNSTKKYSQVRGTTQIQSDLTLQQSIGAFREIHLIPDKTIFEEVFALLRGENSKSHAKMLYFGLLPKNYFEIVMILGSILVGIGGMRNSQSTYQLQSVILFIAASGRLLPSLLRVQSSISILKGAYSYFEFFNNVKYLIDNSDASRTATETSERMGVDNPFTVEFKKVAFSYQKDVFPFLSKISFRLQRGDFALIQGQSGQGKTTILDLTLGILEPSSGEILICGLSTKSKEGIPTQLISYVPQFPTILDGSLSENICLGLRRSDVDIQTVTELLERVQLFQMAQELRDGIDPKLGTEGRKLSGGEMQRLSLARALYRKPRILILDEFTSAMDPDLESAMYELVEAFSLTGIVLCVSHNDNSKKYSNKMFRLDNGGLVEL